MSIIGSLFGVPSAPPQSPPPPPPSQEEETQGTNNQNQTNQSQSSSETTTDNSTNQSQESSTTSTNTSSNDASGQTGGNTENGSNSVPVSDSVTQFSQTSNTPSASELAFSLPAELGTEGIELSDAELRAIATNPSGGYGTGSDNILSLFEPIDSADLAQAITVEPEQEPEGFTDVVKNFYAVSNPDNEIETILKEFV
jgi:hypothetical protein